MLINFELREKERERGGEREREREKERKGEREREGGKGDREGGREGKKEREEKSIDAYNKECLRNVNARVFTNQTNPKNQLSNQEKVPHLPGSHFHDDWAKNVTSRVHVILLTGTIFQLNSRIKVTHVLTKFHEHWATAVTFRVLTCFYYIHIEKNAQPTGGHVFSPIWTIFELVRHINKTNSKIVKSRVFTRKTAPPTGCHVFQRTGTTFELNQHLDRHLDKFIFEQVTYFERDRDIIGTNLLTKFHEDRKINVAFRVFTNKCGRTDDGRTDDGQRPVTKTHLRKTAPFPWQPCFSTDWSLFQTLLTYLGKKVLTKCHDNWAQNVTSRVLTCFHYIHIEKNSPPTGGNVFSPIWTIFELVREVNKTNVLTNFYDNWAKILTSRVFTRKTAPLTGGHVFQRTVTTFELNQHIIKTNILTNFELDRDFTGTKLLTKFHEDRTINVASIVYTNKC
ncbi:hypothetical protein DPMN_038084 [Dreissena polymorpha]|uniref:Uncharacterized protein n=1 Tax=Dreissena polymorpha TaxID=45954 RepID=A0A9D4RMV7_DREPO|nr:hypothetical protein DPMN_038084 [Dreissena polymorpha]